MKGPNVRRLGRKLFVKVTSSPLFPVAAVTKEVEAWVKPGGELVARVPVTGWPVTVHPRMARNWALFCGLVFVLFLIMDGVDAVVEAADDATDDLSDTVEDATGGQ